MEPRLVALTGPLKGTTVPLAKPETIIGREPSNEVAINDPLVSRRHCAIRCRDEEIQVADLESLNGTFVNGVPTRQKVLEHGDRIKIGGTQFLFLLCVEDLTQNIPLIESFEGQFVTALTVKVERQDALHPALTQSPDVLAQNARLARDLAALLRISTAINGIKKAEDLQARLLELIFEVMPVERG